MSVTTLGEAERDRQWLSSLTAAIYRWDETNGWESKRHNQTSWWPVHVTPNPGEDPVLVHADVVAYSSERFDPINA